MGFMRSSISLFFINIWKFSYLQIDQLITIYSKNVYENWIKYSREGDRLLDPAQLLGPLPYSRE